MPRGGVRGNRGGGNKEGSGQQGNKGGGNKGGSGQQGNKGGFGKLGNKGGAPSGSANNSSAETKALRQLEMGELSERQRGLLARATAK